MNTALELAQAVRTQQITATQLTKDTLAHIAQLNPAINAFTEVTRKRALHEAIEIDAAIARGDAVGPLAGVPFAAKNLFDIEGVTTIAGSKIHRSYPPATQDATIIARMKAAGAILVGALNMDEYAYGFVTENQHYGPTHNPNDLTRIAGGSSGGSAAAVAAGMVPLALGTDTNGSIRVPAALCGVLGLKPTFGRLPRSGTFFLSPSLDCVGPFARSVADLATVYDVLQGPHPPDPACAQRAAEPTAHLLGRGTDGLRIGTLAGYFETYVQAEATEAVAKVAQALGATQRHVWPEAQRARAAAFVITASESGNLHFKNLKERASDFDIATRDRLLTNVLTPATWYVQAQRFRRWFVAEVLKLFADVDILLAPATPCAAIPIGTSTLRLNGTDMPARAAMGILTQPISLVGLPVVNIPVRHEGQLPLGVQIIGAPWREADCLRVAAQLERAGFL
jgi:1-carboxybiuret hydrolase